MKRFTFGFAVCALLLLTIAVVRHQYDKLTLTSTAVDALVVGGSAHVGAMMITDQQGVGSPTATGIGCKRTRDSVVAQMLVLAADHNIYLTNCGDLGDILFTGSNSRELLRITDGGQLKLGTAVFSGAGIDDSYIQGYEQANVPDSVPANAGQIFFKDNGAGKTQLCVVFNTGAAQCFATQP